MQVKFSQAFSMITTIIRAQLVPMMVGSPGSGKSELARLFAKTYNLFVIDLRLTQCEPTDLNGYPTIVGERSGYRPFEMFPIKGDKIPEGYSGWLLFLDEMNSATLATQAAAYKLVLDRMVGNYDLHSNVAIICAGNKETDGAIVQPMSTAMQSRLIHLELVADVNEWIEWAMRNDIDHRVTDYLKFKPGNAYNFSPDHTDNTYACLRTWEFMSRLLKVMPEDSKDMLALAAGTVGEGVAREFVAFCKLYKDLPTPNQIENSPETIKVPDEPSVLWALTGSISHNATLKNFEQFMKFINRLPNEFQVVTLKETVRRNPPMEKHPSIQKWIINSAVNLL